MRGAGDDEPDCCVNCPFCRSDNCLGDPVDDWDCDIEVGDEVRCAACEGHLIITSVYPWKVEPKAVELKTGKDWGVS